MLMRRELRGSMFDVVVVVERKHIILGNPQLVYEYEVVGSKRSGCVWPCRLDI